MGGFWFNLFAAIVVVALVQTFFVKLYSVPSGSMEQTLQVNDRILVNRVQYGFSDPKPGDVIVFDASDAWEKESPDPTNPLSYALKWLGGVVGIGPTLEHTLVKRIVAGPGQRVSCCDAAGNIEVDGKSLDETYAFENLPFVPGALDCESIQISARCFGDYTVPDGKYLVLGDHRSNSNDSVAACRGGPVTEACVKLVNRDDIIGRAFAVALPPWHWRGL